MGMTAVVSDQEHTVEEMLEVLAGDFLHALRIEQRSALAWPAETEKRAQALEDHLRLMAQTAELRRRLAAREETREAAIRRANDAERELARVAARIHQVEAMVAKTDGLLKNLPPQNMEAERALLGSVFAAGRLVLERVRGTVTPEDFYRSGHAVIWETMLALEGAGKPVDEVSIVSELRALAKLDEVGLGEVSSLASTVASPENARYYARLVVESSRLRQMITVLAHGQRACFDARGASDAILAEIARRVLAVAGESVKREAGPVHVAAVLAEIQADIQAKLCDCGGKIEKADAARGVKFCRACLDACDAGKGPAQ
jgi:hypothetical protein